MVSLQPVGASVARSCYIVHLPVEILVSILRVDDDVTRPERLEALATVCHQWRDTILACGPLWSNISVDSETTQAQLSTQLARSTNASLSVRFHYYATYPGDEEIEVTRMILHERKRVRQFRLSTYGPMDAPDDTPWDDMVRALGSGPWPRLESLAIHGLLRNADKFVLHPIMPNLRHLVISGISVGDWSCLRTWASSIQSLEVVCHEIDDVFFRELLQFTVLNKLYLNVPLDFVEMVLNYGTLSSLCSLSLDATYTSLTAVLTLLSRAPQLTYLKATIKRLQHPDLTSSVNVTLSHLEELHLSVKDDFYPEILGHLFHECRPLRLESAHLNHLTLRRFEIIAGSALRHFALYHCILDVDELAASLQSCPNLEVLRLEDLLLSGETTTSIPNTSILARLRKVHFSAPENQTTLGQAQTKRFLPFVGALLPPTCSSDISGKVVPSQILHFLPRHSGMWHSVRLEIIGNSSYFVGIMVAGEGNVCRSFRPKSISELRPHSIPECINLLHSHCRMFSRVSSLDVRSDDAVQLFSLQGISFPILETLTIRIGYPARFTDRTRLCVDGLRAVISSAAVVPESPLLRAIDLILGIAPEKQVLPIALQGDLLRMFRSKELVEVRLFNGTWAEE